MKIKLVLDIDPYDEHLAVEAAMSIDEYNFPIWYKLSNGTMIELPVTKARLKLSEKAKKKGK